MSFLPEGYKEPVTSNYMQFEQGENTFRVLSDAVVGWEYWKTINKNGEMKRGPIRLKGVDAKLPPIDTYEFNPKTGNVDMPSIFWAFVVYNRDAQKIQILEIKQSGIRKSINALSGSKSWGDVTKFDIMVTKTGQGKETEYSTMPCPKEDVDKSIKDSYKALGINLEALFAKNGEGEDPFSYNIDETVVEGSKVFNEEPTF